MKRAMAAFLMIAVFFISTTCANALTNGNNAALKNSKMNPCDYHSWLFDHSAKFDFSQLDNQDAMNNGISLEPYSSGHDDIFINPPSGYEYYDLIDSMILVDDYSSFYNDEYSYSSCCHHRNSFRMHHEYGSSDLFMVLMLGIIFGIFGTRLYLDRLENK